MAVQTLSLVSSKGTQLRYRFPLPEPCAGALDGQGQRGVGSPESSPIIGTTSSLLLGAEVWLSCVSRCGPLSGWRPKRVWFLAALMWLECRGMVHPSGLLGSSTAFNAKRKGHRYGHSSIGRCWACTLIIRTLIRRGQRFMDRQVVARNGTASPLCLGAAGRSARPTFALELLQPAMSD